MKSYKPGTPITFRSHHGQVLDGIVNSANEYAIMVSTIIGIFSISHSQVIFYERHSSNDSYEEWSSYNADGIFSDWFDDDTF